MTGATDHAVRKALAELAPEGSSPGESTATTPDLASNADGLLVAWAGFVFGSIMSIAANVLSTWLPAAHQPAGWSPGLAPQIGAAVWPIGLLVSIEVLSRVRWPRGWFWVLARFGGIGVVALGSAIISYGHLRDVLIAWHYRPLAAAVGPLVLDGLMVLCGFALLAISRSRRSAPRVQTTLDAS
ncbi:DUF2637 domain-containing protein [Lentzea sp. JNUCC 0626]|uniref:DUF2637 domain-containing protein n=1 Tax=Lentzea sp. JNUCC 0626 TaxID=3367513 RepID=UPI003749E387